MATDPALHRLLEHAGISTSGYTRDLYFRGCQLDAGLKVLDVGTVEQADMIERCFLPQLRKVIPGLELRLIVPVKKPKPSRAFKKGYTPEPEQEDLL